MAFANAREFCQTRNFSNGYSCLSFIQTATQLLNSLNNSTSQLSQPLNVLDHIRKGAFRFAEIVWPVIMQEDAGFIVMIVSVPADMISPLYNQAGVAEL